MRLAALELVNFRSWKALSVRVPGGPVAIVGPNATGKTSILEAAWYSATLGSHRTSTDAAMVRAGEEAAIVRTTVEHDGRSDLIELEVVRLGRPRTKLGGSPVGRRRDVLGILKASLFAPERVAVVRGDPADRRRFIDELLVQLHPRYRAVIREYERALRQRNALLREAGGRVPAGLEGWDEALAGPGGQLCAGRAEAARALAPAAARAFEAVGGSPALTVAYAPNTAPSSDPAPPSAWSEALRRRIEERRQDETARGVTLVGPHRDDLSLAIGELPARAHASQGEAWLAALALVLGSHEALREQSGELPVLLLDDAFSLLDPERRARLASALPEGTQIIATASDPNECPTSLPWSLMRVTVDGVSGDA